MAGRLAHHLTSGGEEGARALPYLQAAATDAIARYANEGAVRYLETAIAIIESGRAGAPDAQRLFVLHKLLAPALIATRGYAPPRSRAPTLARGSSRSRLASVAKADVFPVNFGLWLYELGARRHAREPRRGASVHDRRARQAARGAGQPATTEIDGRAPRCSGRRPRGRGLPSDGRHANPGW